MLYDVYSDASVLIWEMGYIFLSNINIVGNGRIYLDYLWVKSSLRVIGKYCRANSGKLALNRREVHVQATVIPINTWWRNDMEPLSALLPFVRGIHRSTVGAPLKWPVMRSLAVLSMQAWTNRWTNSREACVWRDAVMIKVTCQVEVLS